MSNTVFRVLHCKIRLMSVYYQAEECLDNEKKEQLFLKITRLLLLSNDFLHFTKAVSLLF